MSAQTKLDTPGHARLSPALFAPMGSPRRSMSPEREKPLKLDLNPKDLKTSKSSKLESRKLVAFLLKRLEDTISGNLFVAASDHADIPSHSDDRDEGETMLSDLAGQVLPVLIQLRDVLLFASQRRWDIFFSADPQLASPMTPGLSPPPSPTTATQQSELSGNNLFTLAVNFLARMSVFASHHRVNLFSVASPPLSLQSITLDIAIIIRNSLAGRLHQTLILGRALLPALEGWGCSQRARMLLFFSEVLQEALNSLSVQQAGQIAPGEPSYFSSRPSQPAIVVEDMDVKPDQDGPGLRGILSTDASGHSQKLYQSSTFLKVFLSSLLSDPWTPEWENAVFQKRALDVLSSLARSKPDLHLDLLQAASHGKATVRQNALGLIQHFFPNLIGHLSVCANQMRHEWTTWMFSDPENCLYCKQPVSGFGLSCSNGRHAPAHVSCLNDEEYCTIVQYETQHGARIGALRYSVVKDCAPREFQTQLTSASHFFELVNLFSMTLCAQCSGAIWGLHLQAYRCQHCARFFHRHCTTSATSCVPNGPSAINDIAIEWSALRKSFIQCYADLLRSEQEIAGSSFEEVAILSSVFTVQYELLNHGVASGGLVISQTGPLKTVSPAFDQFDPFELQFMQRLCLAYIKSGQLRQNWIGTPLSSLFLYSDAEQVALISALRSTGDSDIPQLYESVDEEAFADTAKHRLRLTAPVAKIFLRHLLAKRRYVDQDRWTTTPNNRLHFPLSPASASDRLVEAVDSLLQSGDQTMVETALVLSHAIWPSSTGSLDVLYLLAHSLIQWAVREPSSNAEQPGVFPEPLKNQLIQQYVRTWLAALHSIDQDEFHVEVFEILLGLARKGQTESNPTQLADDLLLCMDRMRSFELDMGSFDAWLKRWFDEIAQLQERSEQKLVFSSLQRVFSQDHAGDAWRVLDRHAQNTDAMGDICHWTKLLAQTGIPLKMNLVLQLLPELENQSITATIHLAHALFDTALRETAYFSESLASTIAQFSLLAIPRLQGMLVNSETHPNILMGLKCTLGSFLLACQIQPDLLEYLEFINPADAKTRSLHKVQHRASTMALHEFFKISTAFIQSITDLAKSEVPSARVISAQFLFALLVCQNPASFVEQAVVIRQSDHALISTAYRYFDPVFASALAPIRMPLLLKFVSVSPDVFLNLIQAFGSGSARVRWLNLDYLYHISVSTYLDPEVERFVPTSLQLRAYLCTPAIQNLFNALSDEDESVRLKVDVLVDSLQQPHFDTIGNALSTAFSVSRSESDRDSLCSLFLRIRARHPTWQILSTRTIIDSLYESIDPKHSHYGDDLKLKLLLLGFSLAPTISATDLMRLKLPFVKLIGFNNCVLETHLNIPSVAYSDLAQPNSSTMLACMHALKPVLDCARKIPAKRTVNGSHQPSEQLVGHCLADIPLRIILSVDLQSLDALLLRDLFDCLLIVLFKHDLGSAPSELAHLTFDAISTCIDLLPSERLLHEGRITLLACFSIFQDKHPNLAVNLLGRQLVVCLECIGRVLAPSECLDFLNTSMDAHCRSPGIWLLIFRSLASSASAPQLMQEFKTVFEQRQDRHILHGTAIDDLQRVFNIQKAATIGLVLDGLGLFLLHIYPDTYHPEQVSALSAFLIKLARHMTDWRNPHREIDVDNFARGLYRVISLLPLSRREAFTNDFAPLFPILVEKLQVSAAAVLGYATLDSPSLLLSMTEGLLQALRGQRRLPATVTSDICRLLDQMASAPKKAEFPPNSTKSPLSTARELLAFISYGSFGHRFLKEHFDLLVSVSRVVIKFGVPMQEVLEAQEAILSIRQFNLLALSFAPLALSDVIVSCLGDLTHIIALAYQDLVARIEAEQYDLLMISEQASQLFAAIKLGALVTKETQDEHHDLWTPYWASCAMFLEATFQTHSSITSVIWPSFADTILFLYYAESSICTQLSDCQGFLEAFQNSMPQSATVQKAASAYKGNLPVLSKTELWQMMEKDVFSCFKMKYQLRQASTEV